MVEVEVSPPPMGTIDTFARLKALFPENYEFHCLVFSRDGSAKGLYHLENVEPADMNKYQLEVIACPTERLKLLPGRR